MLLVEELQTKARKILKVYSSLNKKQFTDELNNLVRVKKLESSLKFESYECSFGKDNNHDSSEIFDQSFIVLPYYPKGTLFGLIIRALNKNIYFSKALSGYLIRNLTEALYELHSKANLAHLDLKLENTVLSP